ncbi:hypothetical protein SK803_04075 [Lentzea sp. BCCO 10_0856]|uniref:Uncharacterized protein n=1 Tax=Lentzea miocenica TaxID=3095431 RepID=A0ABU4STY4_9PSEU|nr:hypothetical protein [Lentzea sp. BCCO 10_0856]MDX8029371.1 hypothetical protein [Lentzea sp. BCCO 10_0856]
MEFGQRGNEREAELLRHLFFGVQEEPPSLRPVGSPGGLLRDTRKRYGPAEEQRFANFRRDIFERFSAFVIAFVQELLDVDQRANTLSSTPTIVGADFWPVGKPKSLTGIWHSHYTYTSSSRPGQVFESEHYMVLKQTENVIVAESIANKERSDVRLLLQVDGAIATGSWSEQTSGTGYYRGAIYHGAIQMVVDPRGRRLRGKWLGFDTEFNVNIGDWTLAWLTGEVNKATQADYVDKV